MIDLLEFLLDSALDVIGLFIDLDYFFGGTKRSRLILCIILVLLGCILWWKLS